MNSANETVTGPPSPDTVTRAGPDAFSSDRPPALQRAPRREPIVGRMSSVVAAESTILPRRCPGALISNGTPAISPMFFGVDVASRVARLEAHAVVGRDHDQRAVEEPYPLQASDELADQLVDQAELHQITPQPLPNRPGVFGPLLGAQARQVGLGRVPARAGVLVGDVRQVGMVQAQRSARLDPVDELAKDLRAPLDRLRGHAEVVGRVAG